MKRLTVLGVALIVLISSCNIISGKTVTLSIKGRPLEVEVAKTKRQRARGLMYRKELGKNEGMLFIFREEQYLSFWMKDTSIPLSIVFLDKNGVVTDMYDMEPFSLEPILSSRKCRYAIEANRHFFREAGISVGDSIELSVVGKR